MKEAFKYWWLVLIKGLILIVLAFLAFGHPIEALVGLVLYLGTGLLLTGIFLIATSLFLRKVKDHWGWQLAEGIVDIIFSLVLLFNPDVTAEILPFVVGFWVMLSGIMTFIHSFEAKTLGIPQWWVGLVSGVFTVVFGYLITSDTLAGAIAITVWMGLGLLLAGFMTVAISVRLRDAHKIF